MVSCHNDSSILSLIEDSCPDNNNLHQSEQISQGDNSRNGFGASSPGGGGCPLLITSWHIWGGDASQQSTCVPHQKRLPAPQADANADGYGDGGWPSIFKPFTQKHHPSQQRPSEGTSTDLIAYSYPAMIHSTAKPAMSFDYNSQVFVPGCNSHQQGMSSTQPITPGKLFNIGSHEDYELTEEEQQEVGSTAKQTAKPSLSVRLRHKGKQHAKIYIKSRSWRQVTNVSDKHLYLVGRDQTFKVPSAESMDIAYTGARYVQVHKEVTESMI